MRRKKDGMKIFGLFKANPCMIYASWFTVIFWNLIILSLQYFDVSDNESFCNDLNFHLKGESNLNVINGTDGIDSADCIIDTNSDDMIIGFECNSHVNNCKRNFAIINKWFEGNNIIFIF